MASETGSDQRKTAAAFTLIELLLVVALVLMLAGAVIINFNSLDRNARLEEGAANLETLCRYARAQAAGTGRQVRIIFGPEMTAAGGTVTSTNLPSTLMGTNVVVRVLWEPDPVNAPGRFEPLPGVELLLEQVNDLVNVLKVRRPGSNRKSASGPWTEALAPLPEGPNTNATYFGEAAAASTFPMTFYPDGSCDSAEILLSAANSEDQRLAVVTFSGLTGASRHQLIDTNVDQTTLSGQNVEPERRDK
jgi:type II secretory pathway pseudopilin PulG